MHRCRDRELMLLWWVSDISTWRMTINLVRLITFTPIH